MTPAIPLIDLTAADAGDSAQLDAIRAATEDLGAVQVVSHGVPEELTADLNARMDRLLRLPRAQKAALASPHPYRGWRQWPDDLGRLELERFNMAQFDDIEAARAAGVADEHLGLFAHANMWPPDDPGLRETAFGYLEAAGRLAGRMLGLYARARGLPEDTFGLGTPPHLRLTVNDYPTWTYPEAPGEGDATDEDKLLLLEHADDSAVTVLAQEGDYEGLQIQAAGGEWIPVPVVPGALQVFSGNLLARWTGGRLRPGRHRVVAGGTVTRRSTAVFTYPSLDTVVGLLPPFAAGPAEAGAGPVLVWDHVRNRVADYLAEYGRPEQVAAWRDGRPYVAALAENSAGRS
jgi:isopenicillin N synthase-like dioxygenase